MLVNNATNIKTTAFLLVQIPQSKMKRLINAKTLSMKNKIVPLLLYWSL
jgi:hypothetical protein